jgi:hypothetical protein
MTMTKHLVIDHHIFIRVRFLSFFFSSYFKINELLPGYTSLPYVRSSYSRYVPVVKFKYCTTVGYFRVVP